MDARALTSVAWAQARSGHMLAVRLRRSSTQLVTRSQY